MTTRALNDNVTGGGQSHPQKEIRGLRFFYYEMRKKRNKGTEHSMPKQRKSFENKTKKARI